jgi:two-component system, chemotaxis family, chemotaxis protein CheY
METTQAVEATLILVVDDERDIRSTVAEMLELEGYAVDEAVNGADALDAVERRTPDVILLDMRMPVLDGWGFARELRHRGRQIPIVVMTAARDAGRWAEEIAATAALSKPFGFDDLLRAVDEARSAA